MGFLRSGTRGRCYPYKEKSRKMVLQDLQVKRKFHIKTREDEGGKRGPVAIVLLIVSMSVLQGTAPSPQVMNISVFTEEDTDII